MAQLYYQLEWPFGISAATNTAAKAAPDTGSRFELTLGKMDLFGFFDQNEVAGDESSAFLNNVFVHNPLLDSGGDIAADDYGFAPGVRLAYVRQTENAQWGASLGVFAAGEAAKLHQSPDRPLIIGQLEWAPKMKDQSALGHYRLYTWTNGQTVDANEARQRHSGVGISADQRVGRDWNVFARWGKRTVGDSAFDRALTLGAELSGQSWGRGDDGLGLAWGRLTGSGTEHNFELYYRFKLNEHAELSPDFQYLRHPAGDSNAAAIRVVGLRAKLDF